MSVKYSLLYLFLCFISSCSPKDEEPKQTELDPIVEKINVENIDLDSSVFQKLKDPTGSEEYKFHSRFFYQTSLINRHVNILGLANNPTITEHIRRASYSYKKAGEQQKAMHLLQLSIDEEADVSKRLNNLDYAAWNYLYFYRDYENTNATVDEILKLTDNDLSMSCHGESCLLLKGQALYRMGKLEEAIAVFSAFQEHEKAQGFDDMDNSLIVFYKARCLTELGKNEEAEKYFLHLVKNRPLAEANYQLALIYYGRKEYSLTNKYLVEAEKAINEGYTFKEPYFERFDKVFPHQIVDLQYKLN